MAALFLFAMITNDQHSEATNTDASIAVTLITSSRQVRD